jgi:putative ABC transport system ATP-binding protein
VEALFRLNNVRYKNILSIEELSIEKGQTTCIVGESGSGKTTLLKLLNHMIDYNEGTICYMEKELKSLNAVLHRREVILLPQVPVIFPGTVRDNLLIGLAYAEKEPVDDERLLGELKKVGLLHKQLDEEAETLSGGEKQRLALIRIMLMEPEVLLLDEPTSALDDERAEDITAYINDYITNGGKTLVLVTHSKQLADMMGRKIISMKNGSIDSVAEVA